MSFANEVHQLWQTLSRPLAQSVADVVSGTEFRIDSESAPASLVLPPRGQGKKSRLALVEEHHWQRQPKLRPLFEQANELSADYAHGRHLLLSGATFRFRSRSDPLSSNLMLFFWKHDRTLLRPRFITTLR